MITAITGIWTSVLSWFSTSMSTITSLFYDSTTSSLTLLGVLAVTGVGISIVLLVINRVKDFIQLRG